VPDRGDQRGDVLHATDEDRTDQDPNERRQPPEEEPREDRPHDRPRCGDSGEVLRQELAGGDWLEVDPVALLDRRHRGLGVKPEQSREQLPVGKVGDAKHDGAGEDNPKQIHEGEA
jgi:hypothetical protein